MAGLRRSRRRRPRRALRVVAVLALALLGLVLVSTVVNLLLERHERATIAPYGERIDIAGGAVNVYRSGSPGRRWCSWAGWARLRRPWTSRR